MSGEDEEIKRVTGGIFNTTQRKAQGTQHNTQHNTTQHNNNTTHSTKTTHTKQHNTTTDSEYEIVSWVFLK
jgi:hypothetical protein